MTDRELIQGILQHDRHAIKELVERFQRQIIKTAYYFTSDMNEAEDITQEVLMEVLNSAGGFRGDSELSTWIYRITVNKSLNQVRKNKRMEIMVRIGNLFNGKNVAAAEPYTNETLTGSRESREILHQAVQSLPAMQRKAFILHKYEELSHREVADVMQVSIPAVESMIHRAKINLRKKLSPFFPEDTKSNDHGIQGSSNR